MDNCIRSRKSFSVLLACLALCPWGTLAAQEDQPGEEIRTIAVDCTAGESINRALRLAAPSSLLHGTKWVIEIHGMCEEDVLVRLSDVTLRGTDPAVDGIAGK